MLSSGDFATTAVERVHVYSAIPDTPFQTASVPNTEADGTKKPPG